MIIRSDAYYKAFQHKSKPIYSGDIKVTFEYGLIRLEQEAIGKIDSIAIHPRKLHLLVEALEKVWCKEVLVKGIEGT